MGRVKSDALCGIFLMAIAAGFGWAAIGYEIGTPRHMGPGFFPLMVAAILGLFGLAILVTDLTSAKQEARDGEREPALPIPWGAGLTILGSVMFFGATVSGLGLVPSLAIAVLAVSRAGKNTWMQSITHCVVLTVLCSLIFQIGLGLRLPLFGPWLIRI